MNLVLKPCGRILPPSFGMNACLSFPSPNLPSLIFPKNTLLFYIPMPLLNLLVCLKNA